MRGFGLILLFCALGRAELLPVKRYTIADGLAGNRVECILRDSRGLLWFGTSEGLSRFDGYQFTTFTEAQGLPRSFVGGIIETRDGIYWLATTGGPCRFDPNKRGPGSRFTSYPAGGVMATAVIEDRSGAIWCGTRAGLYRLPKGGTAFEPVDIGMPLAVGGDAATVSALLEDSQGALWIGTGGALYRRTADGRTSRYTVADGLPPDFGFIQALLEDREGSVWIATRKGLCRTLPRPPLGRSPLIRVYGSHDGLPGIAWTNSLLEASDGKLWAGVGAGIYVFRGREGGAQAPSFRGYTSMQGLAGGNVGALAEDRAGNLWIGTDGNGAMKVPRDGFVGFGRRDGLFSPILALFESRQGELCAVVEEGGVRIFEWFDGRRFVPIRPAFPASVKYFGWGSSQVALQDHAGEWWFATGQGLCRFPRTGSVAALAGLRPKAVYTTRDGLPEARIFRIFEDSRGDIWIGTNNDRLTRWDRAANSFHAVPDVRSTPTAFAEDRNGDIWVGTFDGRVGRLRQGQWSAAAGFGPGRNGTIWCVLADRAGRLWIGTNGPGLFRIDDPGQPQPATVLYTVREGLASIRIGAIAEDRQGRIWVSTARGVDCLDPSTEGAPRIRHYSSADGLAEGEGTLALSDRSGALWFATQHGLSRLIPPGKNELSPPPVLVTGVRVAGAAYPVSDLGETALKLPDLRPGQNQVEIEFGGLQFAAGESLRYQFGMEGQNPEWGPLGSGRSVNFAGLRPGSYRFHVRAVDTAGIASARPAIVSFVIMPPFWQRWWFALLAATAAACMIYAAYRYRLRQMVELERVRMRIATDLHDDIGASLSQIAVLSELARIGAGRGGGVQEPLARIAGISRELVDSMSEIVWAISPQRDRLIDLTRRMRQFAEDVLAPRDIAFRLEAPEGEEGLSLGPELRRQVFLIFKECIHNIARHSDCTRAAAELRIHKNELILCVSDNGSGVCAGDSRAGANGGHGLSSIRRRAESLNGSLNFIAGAGAGVTLVLRAPLAGQSLTRSARR